MSCAGPNPPCGCCREGKHCAYVLKLDARQHAELRRVERIIGLAPERQRVETPDEWLARTMRES